MFSIHSVLDTALEIGIQHFGPFSLMIEIVLVYFSKID